MSNRNSGRPSSIALLHRCAAAKRCRVFLDCVRGCGELLQTHVPVSDQKNELPNHMVIIE